MSSFKVFLSTNKSDKFLRYAGDFYSTYKAELVTLTAGIEKGVGSMLALLKKLADEKAKHVLVISHGWTDGLWLPVVDKSKVTANTDRLTIIFRMWKLSKTFETLIDDTHPEKWFTSAAKKKEILASLKEVFPSHKFTFDDEKAAHKAFNGTSTGKSTQYETIENNVYTLDGRPAQLAKLGKDTQPAVQQQWTNLLGSSGMADQQNADAYFKALKAVHGIKLTKVEIRGCKIGASKASSQVLRKFLGAAKLRAPKVVLVTYTTKPKIEKKETFIAREKKWTAGSGYVKWHSPDRFRADSQASFSKWVKDVVGDPRSSMKKRMPLLWSETKPPIFPKESGFSGEFAEFS